MASDDEESDTHMSIGSEVEDASSVVNDNEYGYRGNVFRSEEVRL